MSFSDFLKNNTVCLDGGMGTLLQEKGLRPGEYPELWNLSHPDKITEIHREYFNAGANVVATNTFGANTLKFCECELKEIIDAAVANARRAAAESTAEQRKFVALDVGPTGKLLKPYGDLDFEDAVAIFANTVRLGVSAGVDLILIETMNDSYETKAALLAAKENSSLPVIVTNAYGEDGRLMTGASPETMIDLIEGMGADAVGANCSLGPDKLRPVIERMLKRASVPVVLKPNAGLPREENGRTVFDVSAAEFAKELSELVRCGVRAVGGCCGTTPEYIKALTEAVKKIPPKPIEKKNITSVSSYTHTVEFGDSPVLIGERINPTGKKKFKEALRSGDINYILNEATRQQEAGVHILDVNVGLPEIDEPSMLTRAVTEIQTILDIPLQIDTANPIAMESALRRYNGKPLINSVNGKAESMAQVFPLAKKYGGVIIALTLDEGGIPDTAEDRVAIAERILCTAEKYGIDKKNIIFDPLALTVSTGNNAARVTLSTLKKIREKLCAHTSLGISNVSYGLPARDAVNGTFFAMALQNGLSAAIMNPYSAEMMKVYYAYRALCGLDESCLDFISHAPSLETASIATAEAADARIPCNTLPEAIERGLADRAREIAQEYVKRDSALSIVNGSIIPSLDKVGAGYEEKRIFLPQLLMSAEAAKAAFEVIKAASRGDSGAKGPFVIATVEGDIHDIGKNIVKLILENYGYRVVDLGRDVKADAVVEAAIRENAAFVGLSALMTTTLPAMERTAGLLREKAPGVRIIVGGAVLTAEYAKKIGADKYARDAMDAVRYLASLEE